MKKIMFFAAAVLAVLGCSKEKTGVENVPVMNAVTIRATAGEITKTTYTEEKTFAWEAGDKISVLGVKGSSMKFFVFETAESGASVNFTGLVEEGYQLGDYAVYPETLEPSISGGKLHMTLPSELSDASELKNLPLVGLTSGENAYSFKTATGIVKFTLENLWANAASVKLTSLNEPLSGEFALAPTAGALTFDAVVSGEMTLKAGIEPDAAGTAVFYVPVPEGSLAALDVTVLDKDNNELGTKSSTKEIAISRNKVLPLKALPMRTWHVKTVAGSGAAGSTDGIGAAAVMNIPQDLDLAPDGTYWFTQRNNASTHGIRSYNPETHEVKSISVAVAPLNAAFPWGCAFGPDGNLYVACKGSSATNKYLVKVDYTTKTPSIYTPEGFPTITATNQLMSVTFDKNGYLYVSDRYNLKASYIYKIKDDKVVSTFNTVSTESMELDYAQKNLILGGNNSWLLKQISVDGGSEVTLAGSGTKPLADPYNYTDGEPGQPLTATIGMIEAICQDSKGNIIFGDMTANTLRMLSPGPGGSFADGTVKTILGQPFAAGSVDGEGNASKLQNVTGIARLTDDSYLILCGASSNRIRKVWLE